MCEVIESTLRYPNWMSHLTIDSSHSSILNLNIGWFCVVAFNTKTIYSAHSRDLFDKSEIAFFFTLRIKWDSKCHIQSHFSFKRNLCFFIVYHQRFSMRTYANFIYIIIVLNILYILSLEKSIYNSNLIFYGTHIEAAGGCMTNSCVEKDTQYHT